jgi:hypothetical protein
MIIASALADGTITSGIQIHHGAARQRHALVICDQSGSTCSRIDRPSALLAASFFALLVLRPGDDNHVPIC